MWVNYLINRLRQRHTVTFSTDCDFVFGVISYCTSDKPPLRRRHRRGLVLPCTPSAVWHTHACAIHTAQGLITWHTYMTSSACNQIHMCPSLLLLLVSRSISISRWNSFPLLIHPWLCLHVPLSVCFSFIPCPPPSLLASLSFAVFLHLYFFMSVSCFWSQPGPQHGLCC